MKAEPQPKTYIWSDGSVHLYPENEGEDLTDEEYDNFIQSNNS